MKKIILTGGGTSGHITPNIALLGNLKQEGYTVEYIGSKNGLEKNLVNKENITFHSINSGKLRRYFDLKNFTDIFKITSGLLSSVKIMKKSKANVVFSKGGFVSAPVVWAAWLCRVPVVIHESDITPGLSNKLSMPFARKICYAFPESKNHIRSDKGVHTGIPIRSELKFGNKENGFDYCGFSSDLPVITIMGGSQGSKQINGVIRDSLDELTKDFQVCHICGKGNLSGKRKNNYFEAEYINDELKDVFKITDIFIGRSGATTLFELLELSIPSLLIPLSKKVSRGDQILNANSFKKQGFSCVLDEDELDKKTFMSSIKDLYENKATYIKKMNESSHSDSVNNCLKVINDVRK